MSCFFSKKKSDYSRRTSEILFIFLFSYFFVPLLALAQLNIDESDRENENSSRLSRNLQEIRRVRESFVSDFNIELDRQGFNITEQIWNEFSRLHFPMDFQIKGQTIGVGLNFDREVQENLDAQDSYTVIDRIHIPINIPFYSRDVTELLDSGFPISVRINYSTGLDIRNYKRVVNTDPIIIEQEKKKVKSKILELQREVFYEKSSEELEQENTQGGDEENEEERTLLGFNVDSLTHVRYSRVLNRIAFPLRIPLKASVVEKLGFDEVMTYKGYGVFSFGPSVSLSTGIPGLSAGFNATTFLGGEFKTSVLRVKNEEGKERVLVKTVRVQNKGISFSFNEKRDLLHNGELIDGLVILENMKIINRQGFRDWSKWAFGDYLGNIFSTNGLNQLNNLLPRFSIALNKTFTSKHEHLIEVAYEFDLQDDEAKQAYEDMMMGGSRTADILALQQIAMGTNAAVRKVYGQDANIDSNNLFSRFYLGLLGERTRVCSDQLIDADIEVLGAEYKEWRAKSFCDFSQRGFFKQGLFFGDRRYGFHFEGSYLKDKQTEEIKYGLFGTGYVIDEDASGAELNHYAEMVNVIFDEEILPKVPTHLKVLTDTPHVQMSQDEINRMRRKYNGKIRRVEGAYYGRSYINWIVSFPEEQVLRLMDVPNERILEIIEIIFFKYLAKEKGERPLTYLGLQVGAVLNKIITFPVSLLTISCKACEVHSAMRDMYKGWSQLKISKEPKEAVEYFRQMLNNSLFGYEYIQALILALGHDAQLSYEFSASSDAYGPPVFRKGSFKVDRLTLVQDKIRYFRNIDTPQVLIGGGGGGIGINDLSVDVVKEGYFNVSFNPIIDVDYIYIEIEELDGLFNRKKFKAFVRNKSSKGKRIFKKNEIAAINFNSKSSQSYAAKLMKSLEEDANYKITILVSDDEGKTFSSRRGAQKKFRTK